MSNAENSDRRRRVIIMQSDGTQSNPSESPLPKSSDREPEPRRLPESDLPQSLLSDFRHACGQTSPLRVRISSSATGTRPQTFLWDRPSLIIGRSRECDLQLNHAEISRQHTYLQIVGGRVYCADLGSGTGTHWSQGANSRQQGPLALGEAVSIGPYSFTVDAAPQHGSFGSSAADDSRAPVNAQGLFLDFQDGSNEPRRWSATRDVSLIGSGSLAKVQLVHPTVSKSHCAVIRTRHALWVVDLLSEEGTLVNGKLVSVARLEADDVVQVGRFSIDVHYGSPLDDAANAFSPADSNVPPKPALTDRSKALSDLQERALAAAARSNASGGVSEQFVLDVINQMGVMQQQALKHAQQSMVQALQAVSASYQSRIETLEQEYESLKQQLRGLPGPVMPGDPQAPRGIPDLSGEFGPLMPLPPGMLEPEFNELPDPEHGSYECDDPHVREQWVREKMKLVEAELDKARKGWGKRLIELMGY